MKDFIDGVVPGKGGQEVGCCRGQRIGPGAMVDDERLKGTGLRYLCLTLGRRSRPVDA